MIIDDPSNKLFFSHCIKIYNYIAKKNWYFKKDFSMQKLNDILSLYYIGTFITINYVKIFPIYPKKSQYLMF